MTGDPKKFGFKEDKKGAKGEGEGKEGEGEEEEEEGALCDVAPTVLALLGLDQPEGAFLLSRLALPSRVTN